MEDIIDLFPLIKSGEIVDYSYHIHKLLVTKILLNHESTKRLKRKILLNETKAEYNLIDFPREKFEKILNELQSEGLIDFNEGEIIILNALFKIKQSNLLHDYFLEFEKYLYKHFSDYDPYKYANFETCFEGCLNRIMDRLIQSQRANWDDAEPFKIDEIKVILKNVLSVSEIEKADKFFDAFVDYLKSGEPRITELIYNSYKLAISYDILEQGSKLSKLAPDICKDGVVVLDSNVLTYLLCITDPKHSISKTIVEATNSLGIKIYYTQKTADEVHSILKGALEEISTGQISVDYRKMNQFLADFNRRELKSLGGYYSDMENFEKILESKYMISPLMIEKSLSFDTELVGELEDLFPDVAASLEKSKSRSAIDHDIHLFSVVNFLRGENPDAKFSGPWILSFEKTLNIVNNLVKKRLNDPLGFAIHPNTWLDILMCFRNLQFNPEQRYDLVKALIGQMIFPDDKISLGQYTAMISHTLELLPEEQISLEHMVTTSVLKRELVNALQKTDSAKAISVTYEIIMKPELRETIGSETKKREKEKEIEERIEFQAGKLMELTKEKAELVKERDKYKAELETIKNHSSFNGGSILQGGIHISVNNHQEVTQETKIRINWNDVRSELKKLKDAVKKIDSLDVTDEIKLGIYFDDLEKELIKTQPTKSLIESDFKKIDNIITKLDDTIKKSKEIISPAKKIIGYLGPVLAFCS